MHPFNPTDFLILVVDDVSNNLQVLGSILDEVGYSTTFATSGQRALDRIHMAKPDLILLDMMMPHMNGLEVCDRLKSDPETQEIPIIFITASQESQHLLKAFEKGAADYVTKPFNTHELLARVRNQLELKHTQDRLKNTLKELVESRDAALHSARIKSQFLANMSHEIRTPMNAVLGMTELLLETDLNSQQIDYVKTLKNSGSNLLFIINEILDYSKLESGEMPINLENFDIRTNLKELEKLFKSILAEKSLTLTTNIDGRVPQLIKADTYRIRQILINLISNAIKFTNYGQITVKVTVDVEFSQVTRSEQNLTNTKTNDTERSSSKKFQLRFEVQDTGIGIKLEDREKIFQSFFQADGSSTRQYAGTGLGLAICQQLVQLMNGKIGVESEIGKGSIFWFTATFESSSVEEVKPPKQLSSKLERKFVHSFKLLVVEDTRVNQKVILQQLKRLGYTADCVNNGQEALDRLESNDYDIVLMDCQMPILDGYTATKKLRERESKQDRDPQTIQVLSTVKMNQTKSRTVVIGLTAYAMKGDREKCLAAGMDDYLSKPVSINDLSAMLHKWSTTEIRQ